MRICIVSAQLALGGAGIVATEMAQGLAERGHEVLLAVCGEHRSSYRTDGYAVEVLATGRSTALLQYLSPHTLKGLASVLADFRPDLVNFHNINARSFSLAALLLSRRYPSVWTLHDVWPVCVAGWPEPADCRGMLDGCRNCPTWPNLVARGNRLLKEATFQAADLEVVTPSRWLAALLEDSSRLGRRGIKVIPNGVNPQWWQRPEGARERLGLDAEATVILFSGGRRVTGKSPAERKGWSYLRRALEQSADHLSNSLLLYVGEPVELPDDFPVTVEFAGAVEREEMRDYYAAADIFALPTLADNAPLTVLEAMACGAAVVATRVGGIPEVVTHGETGLLCPARSADALAVQLRRAIEDDELRLELVERARRLVERDYSVAMMLEAYERLFGRVIASCEST